jgi:hypothetical protein
MPMKTRINTVLGLNTGRRDVAAAEAEATKNNWAMAIIILNFFSVRIYISVCYKRATFLRQPERNCYA